MEYSVRSISVRTSGIMLAALVSIYSGSVFPKPPKRTLDLGVVNTLSQPVFSDWGYITRFSTAWNDDAMAVYHQPLGSASEVVASQFIHCPIPSDSYATDPGQAARKLQHAALIGAYLHHKQVQFLIKGCAYGKPRIISVGVRD